MKFDYCRSLIDLGVKINQSPVESSLVESCKKAIAKPLEELDLSEIRMLLIQNIGLPFLVPLALKVLQEDPLVKTDFYKGDLLFSVVGIPKEFWDNHEKYNNQIVELKMDVEEIIETINTELMPLLRKFDFK